MGGVGNYGGISAIGAGLGGKRVIPTFGVSFGLPSVPAGPLNGYPLNPYGSYPLQNPYFGSISSNGLNLGLLNVNPLVSFQVAKNEFGEKLFRPLVNLHVTPNANIVQQIGAYLKSKNRAVGGGPSYNKHYHTHTHLQPPLEIYHPHHSDRPSHISTQNPYSSGSDVYDTINYNELPIPSDLTNLPFKPEYYYGEPNAGSPYPISGSYNEHPSKLLPINYNPSNNNDAPISNFSPNNGYGLNGQSGIYREANSNADFSESFNGTNHFYSGNFMYQDFYPQNNQLQTNRPIDNHYANKYKNYDNLMTYEPTINTKDYFSSTSRNSKAVKFPTSRRRKRSAKTVKISKDIVENESKTITKVRLKND